MLQSKAQQVFPPRKNQKTDTTAQLENKFLQFMRSECFGRRKSHCSSTTYLETTTHNFCPSNIVFTQANRGFATEEVYFLSFFSTSGYVGFFGGGWIEKRGERSAGYGFTEMQFLRKPDLHGMTECRMAEWWDGGMAEWRNGGKVFYYIPNLSCSLHVAISIIYVGCWYSLQSSSQ